MEVQKLGVVGAGHDVAVHVVALLELGVEGLHVLVRVERRIVGELHEASKRLAHAGKNVTGVLLNGLDLTRRHYGSYAYRYGGYRYRQYSYGQDN